MSSGEGLEVLNVGGELPVLYLKQDTEDPDVSALSFAQAQAKLTDALHNIKELRERREAAHAPQTLAAARDIHAGPACLALDEFGHTDFTQHPHLPLEGITGGPTDRSAVAAPPISSILSPITLDALLVADDPGFLEGVAGAGKPTCLSRAKPAHASPNLSVTPVRRHPGC